MFLGRDIAQHRDYSEQTAIRIDHEVRRIVEDNYERARILLTEHVAVLTRISEDLLERETLDLKDIDRIIAEVAPDLSASLPKKEQAPLPFEVIPKEQDTASPRLR